MMKKILCIAVHPDDETLAAGGSLLKWQREGSEIHWLILTKIDSTLGFSSERIEKRKKEIERVQGLFKFNSVNKADFLSTKLDEYPLSEIIAFISKIISDIKPDTLLIPHRFDAHSDHRIAYEALTPFLKSFRYPFVKTVLALETLSETGYSIIDAREAFVPNFFVDISETMDMKLSIMRCYDGELLPHPFPRSEVGLISQAQLRGAFISTQFAEAFQILKMIY